MARCLGKAGISQIISSASRLSSLIISSHKRLGLRPRRLTRSANYSSINARLQKLLQYLSFFNEIVRYCFAYSVCTNWVEQLFVPEKIFNFFFLFSFQIFVEDLTAISKSRHDETWKLVIYASFKLLSSLRIVDRFFKCSTFEFPFIFLEVIVANMDLSRKKLNQQHLNSLAISLMSNYFTFSRVYLS